MANLKVGVQFDASDLMKDIQKAVKDANTTIKGIKPETIKPQIEIPAGSIAALKAQLKDLTAKRNIAIGVDVGAFNKEIAGVKKEIKGLETQGKESGKFFAGNFLGNIQALGVAGIAAGAFSFAKGGLKGFEQDAARSQLLTTALENTGRALDGTREKLAAQEKQLAKTTLFTDDQIRAVQAQGVAAGLSGEALTKFTKGTLDFAQAQGKDAVISAQRFGKAITEGKDAVDDNGESLGKAETQFAKFAGAAEKAATGPAGAAKQAQKAFEDFQEKVGGILAQVIASLGPALFEIIDATTPLLEAIGPVIGAFFNFIPIAAIIQSVVGQMKALVKIISEDFLNILSSAGKLFVAVFTFDISAIKESFGEIQNIFAKAGQSLFTAAVSPFIGVDEEIAKFDVLSKKIESKPPPKSSKSSKAEKSGEVLGPSLEELQKGARKLAEQKIKDEEDLAAFLESVRLNANEKELEAARKLYQDKIDLANKLGQDTVELEQHKENALKKINDKHLDDVKKIAKAELEIERQKEKQKLDVFSEMASNLQSIFGEQTAVAKFAAVSAATIATYEAANMAYLRGLEVPGIGLALGPISAALAVVAGLANVSKIAGIALPSFASGKEYVDGNMGAQRGPTGGYIIEAHEGEAVLTREENKRRRSDGVSIGSLNDAVRELNATMKAGIATEIREYREDVVTMQADGRELKGVLHTEEKHTRNNSFG